MKRTMGLVECCSCLIWVILRPSGWRDWTRVCIQASIDVLKAAARMMLSVCRADGVRRGGKARVASTTTSDPNETFGRLAWRVKLEYPEVARSTE